MSEEQKTETPKPAIAIAIAMATEVKANIKERCAEVRSTVVKNLADGVIAERVQLLTKTLDKRKELEKAVKSVKPDQKQFDLDGKEVSATYTQETIKKLKEAKEKLAKADKAIKKAIEEADFEDIKKV